ncbi:MAG TPA: hypothetical protein VNT75_32390 [Symbiobacteriaceae bacterium]|nr:hypothetical protein [Symbiobacteriaceae bacterium]
MGAKFIVDRRCPVKSQMTLTGLIEAIKQKSLLRRIGELAVGGPLASWDPEMKIEVLLPPEAGVPGELTVRDLQQQVATLTKHSVTCRMCPSSLNGHVGGCIAYVPYPLSEGLEFLLWTTAVRGLEGDLPEELAEPVAAFARKAQAIKLTPYADGMRKRGDLLSQAPRQWQRGPVWGRERLTSAQVLEAFFLNGMLAGDDLETHAAFLTATLAVARGMEKVLKDDEQRQALAEDVEPYAQVCRLMMMAQDQGFGIYVWP